ncbi:hypothetical protein [uncultured Agrococcus sp.]|uniref:hypothetical protein n=1 Tax=uncultured Agrococcus sp. TaxID=382258 RepID=UPI0025FC3280|nr:hypothetical protein [uncultured Agrococcus sp.]
MVAATDEIAASYIDVLDPEERQQRVVNFMRWLTRAENESAIRDEQERRRIFNDPAGLDWVVRGILEQRLLLGYEWELGSRMGVTSREGVQYAAVVEDEFVAYVSKAFVTERVFVARRYLKQFAEIIQYRTGRAPRNSTPLSDEETLRGTVLDPMQWNTDHVSTEQEELELIGMYAEAMHQERMVYEAEMSRRRRETAKSVGLLAGGAALWAVGASLQHSANKQARSDEALSRDYMQTMIDREQRIAAKERNRRWGL